mgnify:FL=1
MGQYRIEITAVGGHGCERQVKDGQKVWGCRRMGCPDCETRNFVDSLRRQGQSIEKATLTHWPETPTEVRDDLVTSMRTGSF